MLVNPSDRLVIAATPGVDPAIFARGLGYAPSELAVDPHNSHGVMTRSWVDGDIHDYTGISSGIREAAKPNVPRAKGFNLAVVAFNLDDLFSDWGKQLWAGADTGYSWPEFLVLSIGYRSWVTDCSRTASWKLNKFRTATTFTIGEDKIEYKSTTDVRTAHKLAKELTKCYF